LVDAINASRLFQRGMVSADSFGFALGRFPGASPDLDPRLRFMGHVLTCAPTGSGKGIGAVIPTLLEYPGSALVLDLKGENYAVTARARHSMGHAVCLVDPFGVISDAQAAAFNPLDILDLTNPDVVGQASALVDTVVVVGANQDDNSAHFNDSAKELIKGLVVYAKSLPQPERRTLGEVRRLLTLPLATPPDSVRESLMSHLADMSANAALAFGIPSRCANGFMSKDPKEASGVHSTALRHTAFLDDPRIAAALSRSDFQFADLKRQPMTVYVVMPPDRITAQSRFLRALVGAALSAITATNEKPQYNVLFLLDEFAQLGRMQSIEDAISLVRGYGARFWLLVQDLSQLKGVYPKWQTFLANSAKQFFGTADYETAKYVSDMLGQTTIEFRTSGDSSTASIQGGSSGTSSSQQLAARSLLTPDEVMRQGSMRPIVLIQGERPYSLERINYLADPEYAGLADANPFHR
jgi:type IV secretion system protein VirD4